MATKSNTPLNVVFINAFLNATVEVLEMMAETKAQHGRPFMKRGENSRGDVTGLIGMAGKDNLKGIFAVSFKESTILHIVSEMLGEVFTVVDEEVIDAVGEITNMISGAARAALSDKGREYGMATPTVIHSVNHSITQVTKAPVIVMPFTTPGGGMLVEVALWRGATTSSIRMHRNT